MSQAGRNGANGTKQASGKEADTQVEYIRLNERQIIIKTTRPGEEPVETIAAVFPSRNGYHDK
jgi:hypothetical protein